MNIYLIVYIFFLFIALVPGIFITIPIKYTGNEYTGLLIHAIIFSLILNYTLKFFLNINENFCALWDNGPKSIIWGETCRNHNGCTCFHDRTYKNGKSGYACGSSCWL
jgi:hypothetical protein